MILLWVGESDNVFNDNCDSVYEDGEPSSTCAGTGPFLALAIFVLVILWALGVCLYTCYYRMFKGFHSYEGVAPQSERPMSVVKDYAAPLIQVRTMLMISKNDNSPMCSIEKI